MASNPLTPDEARALVVQAASYLRWVTAVLERLKARGYGPQDLLWREMIGLRDKAQDAHVAAQYEGMKHGIGREQGGG